MTTINSPINAPGGEERPKGALSLERGHLSVAFYRMLIGQFLAEIWPKTSRNPAGLGSKEGGGGFIRGGAFIGEFTAYSFALCLIVSVMQFY